MGAYRQLEKSEAPQYAPLIITGAPRTGTTVLHAMICTASECNAFTPEFHYLASVVGSLGYGLATMETATKVFAGSKASLNALHGQFIRDVLDLAWRQLGSFPTLAIKHNSLTPYIRLLSDLIPEARFIVIIRSPEAVMQSHERAWRRFSGAKLPEDKTVAIAKMYEAYYGHVIDHWSNLKNRTKVVQYETLSRQLHDLRDFVGVERFQPEELWKRATFDIKDYHADPMFSESWGQDFRILTADVESLSPSARHHVDTTMTPVYRRMLDAARS